MYVHGVIRVAMNVSCRMLFTWSNACKVIDKGLGSSRGASSGTNFTYRKEPPR